MNQTKQLIDPLRQMQLCGLRSLRARTVSVKPRISGRCLPSTNFSWVFLERQQPAEVGALNAVTQNQGPMVNKIPDKLEPLILAIETATRAGSVALARGKEILRSTSGDASASHSNDLIASIERILENAGAKLSDVDLFGVAVGPGSFTGLRIGLATTKSFAVCTGKRCAGVSTLAAIAHAAGNSRQTVSLLPAGRGELFAQLFSVEGEDVQDLDSAAHRTARAILERYGEARELVWAGDGARLQVEALRDWASTKGIAFAELKPGLSGKAQPGWSLAFPSDQLAVSIAALALNTYNNGNTLSPDELMAVYVRASDAEINEQWQREKLRQPAPV